MRHTLCSDTLVGRTPAEAIRRAAELGYRGIELVPAALASDVLSFSSRDQQALAGLARDCGIDIVGFHWLLAGPVGLHVTSPDPIARQRTLDYFRKLIEIATHTGGRILTLGSPKQRSFGKDDTHTAAADRFVAFFQELSADLVGTGVTVALEPLELEYTNFVNSTAEACRLVDAIGSSSIGVTLDTHFLRWECADRRLTVREAFRLTGKRLAHLHIQDDNFLAPGMGKADFTEFLAAAREIGWQGALSLEPFGVIDARLGDAVAAAGAAFFQRL